MSDFFLELFSEEIPASLQKTARKIFLDIFTKLFEKKKYPLRKIIHVQFQIDLLFYLRVYQMKLLNKRLKFEAQAPKRQMWHSMDF